MLFFEFLANDGETAQGHIFLHDESQEKDDKRGIDSQYQYRGP